MVLPFRPCHMISNVVYSDASRTVNLRTSYLENSNRKNCLQWAQILITRLKKLSMLV